MASFKNAAPSRIPRERDQPAFRKKVGFLEHHKDYVKRAEKANKDKAVIRELRLKATFRNPDEFNVKMLHSKMSEKGIVVVKSEGKKIDPEKELLLRTQDSNYFNMIDTIDRKKIEILKSEIALADAKKKKIPNKHTVFVDTEEEFDNFNAEQYFNSPLEIIETMPYNRVTKDQLRSGPLVLNSSMVDRSRPLLRPLAKNYVSSLQALSEAQLTSKEAELTGRIRREEKIRALVFESNEMRDKLLKKKTLPFQRKK
eukprot:TRINITY_DN5200_c0_g1_i1.p1 TRINITY_DN5200_c0_g1~~TRINITY_DN5200_c0_g1_i1.p1  ORF type:complete len:274 (+),score=145.11 TRINITY_DN5200_c0_g1_i1:57-824(+)